MTDRIWLHNETTDGYFHAPADVAEQWAGLGWKPAEQPPPEHNPATAEREAWLEDKLAEQADDGEDPDEDTSTTKKTTRRRRTTAKDVNDRG
jgi:hypothetical protein